MMKTKIRYCDPVVVPAHPGFRSVCFNNDVTEETQPGDLTLFEQPILAWMIQPALEGDDARWYGQVMMSPDVKAITMEGTEDDAFVVDPDGKWHLPHDVSGITEEEARRRWIESELRQQKVRQARLEKTEKEGKAA